jgi:predicted nuclease with TOPRIM domain
MTGLKQEYEKMRSYFKGSKAGNEAINKCLTALNKKIEEIKKLKKSLQHDLTRIASQWCKTPTEAIEQRVQLEQVHVTITHLDDVLKLLDEEAEA